METYDLDKDKWTIEHLLLCNKISNMKAYIKTLTGQKEILNIAQSQNTKYKVETKNDINSPYYLHGDTEIILASVRSK